MTLPTRACSSRSKGEHAFFLIGRAPFCIPPLSPPSLIIDRAFIFHFSHSFNLLTYFNLVRYFHFYFFNNFTFILISAFPMIFVAFHVKCNRVFIRLIFTCCISRLCILQGFICLIWEYFFFLSRTSLLFSNAFVQLPQQGLGSPPARRWGLRGRGEIEDKALHLHGPPRHVLHCKIRP